MQKLRKFCNFVWQWIFPPPIDLHDLVFKTLQMNDQIEAAKKPNLWRHRGNGLLYKVVTWDYMDKDDDVVKVLYTNKQGKYYGRIPEKFLKKFEETNIKEWD